MNIPDPAVYALLPTLGGMAVWIGTAFIKSVTGTSAPVPAIPNIPVSMTVRDYQQISELLKKELNGRYMFAEEARNRFDAIEHKLDGQSRLMADNTREFGEIAKQVALLTGRKVSH